MLAFFPSPPPTGPVVRRGGTLFLPFHAVRSTPPPSEWLTDEDVFGMLVLEDGAERLGVHPIPQRFPEQNSGAMDALREFELLGQTARQFLVLLESPFGTASWGIRRFLYAFELGERRWRRLECPERGAPRVDPLARATDPGDPASGEHRCGADVEWAELGGTVHLYGEGESFRPHAGAAIPDDEAEELSADLKDGRLLLRRSRGAGVDVGPWPELVLAHLGPGAKNAQPWSAAATTWNEAPAVVLTLRTPERTIDDPAGAVMVIARPPDLT